MSSSVRIMMATYNGEKYLCEQLDSIINQTYQNWNLIVQDDGSKDKTWDILNSYAKKDKRITVKKSPEKNSGAYYNFHSIANEEKKNGIVYDYYMFSDQDDIWDRDKIEKMLTIAEKEDDDIPFFCYADMRIVDDYGKVLIDSISDTEGLKYQNSISLFFSHIIYGCNVMMNEKAFSIVPIINTNKRYVGILSHDNLYAKISGMTGKVMYIPITTMSYRRHQNNVTSKHEYGYNIRRILKRLFLLGDLAKDHARTYNQSIITLRLMNEIKGVDKTILKQIEKSIRSGGIHSLHFINVNHVNWGKVIKNISHKLIIFLGVYKKYLIN